MATVFASIKDFCAVGKGGPLHSRFHGNNKENKKQIEESILNETNLSLTSCIIS